MMEMRSGLWALVAGLALLLVAACGGNSNDAGGAINTPPAKDAEARLLVADTNAEVVYVYSVPGFEQLGRFDGIKLSAHMGAIALPDGRSVFVDDRSAEVVVLQTLGESPSIVARTKAASPAIWGGVDAGLEFLAYSSVPDDSADKLATATLVNLKDYTTHELKVPMGGDGELHIALGGSPLTLYLATATELQSYLVSDVVAGKTEAAARVPVNSGLHGAVISQETPAKLLLSSAASFDVYDVSATSLKTSRPLAWDAAGLSGGRNGRPRLSNDGGYVYGALAAPVPAEGWQMRQNDVHIVNLRTEAVGRMPLAPGIVGRFQLSQKYALFPNIQPDGDFAILFDTEPASPTFQQVVARIPLTGLTNGPKAGETASGKETRGAAITPDGRWAFVSHGGDATISVIDTETRSVRRSITTPTPLKGGGYLLAVQAGARLVDTQVR